MPEMMEVDAEIVGSLAAANDLRWRQLFEMPVWSELRAVTQGDVDQLIDIAYGLGLVAPFDWQAWYSPDRFPAGHGLAAASVADAVRLITAIVRGDVAAVKAAVEAGVRSGEKVGEIVAVHVIPRPHVNVDAVLPLGRTEEGQAGMKKE